MEVKFFTEKGVMDLSSQKISFQEGNSKLNDKQLTKFTFPFEIYVDEEFTHTFGDYVSHEVWDIPKVIEGKLLFENRIHDAKLEIMSIEGKFLTGQIDFGFEEIPNHDKKLSELPLEVIEVANIYEYAAVVCSKKYPETNFNFPRIHTKKYKPSEVMWDAFEGYYNHAKNVNGQLKFAENVYPTEQNGWTIDNVNIVHPCPHILYLLKTGFEDAGYELQGDILQDKNLQDKWVFSGGQYFKNQWILNKEVLRVNKNQYKRRNIIKNPPKTYGEYEYEAVFTIEKADQYRLDFHFTASQPTWVAPRIVYLKIEVNGVVTVIPTNNEYDFFKSHFLTIQNANTEVKVSFRYDMELRSGTVGGFHGSGSGTDPVIPEILVAHLRSQSAQQTDSNENAEEYKVVVNENKIDLTRAVPNLTFNEFVNIIQNWFNYDVQIVGRTVYMNKIGFEAPPEPKDFRAYEVKSPKRTLKNEKSFFLKFMDLDDGYKLDAVYYDKNGIKLNGVPGKKTSTIEINGYVMPIAKAKENHTPTAQVKKDSDTILSLVHYEGLINGMNDALNPPGCTFPLLFETNWEKWLSTRINSDEYQWSFTADIARFSHFKVTDYLYCYSKKHIIKTINKDKISSNTYEVEITTETVL
ncbi:hypothetical protein [Bergeyella zoohelcum]|uniref:Uncharacterized protein n=1 Tax=Bergeyella zoohelcum TaxID=1015 RepID=A0A376BXY5_9FLAO|nr:hypothetical protein [Bergeyella zoohelcum]EKB61395.1 hypothetical protein HMPREF9700_00890 [Bergeyella zoohelcum CCUG 30536]SSZ46513.1 Uncharacterised protein [Bergeyella zoohelcum]SUV52592.1 Uncharacterised protein [Bergeyella zoohelcum]